MPIENPFLRGGSALRSLNRVWLPDGNGGGQRAFALLSATALAEQAARALGWPEPDRRRLQELEALLSTPGSDAIVAGLAARYGRAIADLVHALRHPSPATRAARPLWQTEHWAFWQSIEAVIVGGGLVSGPFGALAVAKAQATLGWRKTGMRLTRAKHGRHLPLLGLARRAPADARRMFLFDFGHSAVKTAAAYYKGGTVAEVVIGPEHPAPCPLTDPTDRSLPLLRRRWAAMRDIILKILAAADGAGERVAVSIAAYLVDGRPWPEDRGCYTNLQVLDENLAGFMQRELAGDGATPAHLFLEHDATAAATRYAERPNTLVLMLGTAIGNGFPPVDDGLRPYAADLKLSGW